MPHIPVFTFTAAGRHLYRAAVYKRRDRAVPDPGFKQTECEKSRFHFLWCSCRGNIPVMRRFAAQHIPHAAAHNPGTNSRAGQSVHNRRCLIRYPEFFHIHPALLCKHTTKPTA